MISWDSGICLELIANFKKYVKQLINALGQPSGNGDNLQKVLQ